MAEEFVDLYQVLDLPVDAEAGTVRKRLSERYLEAQRNLEHRNFATRVKFQEEFEVTLPQARYILLDPARRAEYDRLVHAFRTANSPGAPAFAPDFPPAAPATETSPPAPPGGGFTLENASSTLAGIAPTIEPLPPVTPDPAQLALEREELWKKWKGGLEAAMGAETEADSQARATETPVASGAAPDSALVSPVPTGFVAPPANAAPKAAARPKIDISLDFGEQTRPVETPQSGGFAPETGATALTNAEIEARRDQNRRQITKEVLVNVGLIWGIVGALVVIVPGALALIALAAHFYPRGGKPLLTYSPAALWGGGFLVIATASFFASSELSKAMRHSKARQLSLLSYEELVKQSAKN